MAQTPASPTSVSARRQAGNDIFTAMVSISLVLVVGTLAFVIYRCNELLGTPLPGFMS